MNKTQDHLSILDIQDDIILLKDRGGALVLQTNAVNFGLLSEREQMAIISSFAQMLNSLSFPIQIVIHSERLDISSYLDLLDKAQKSQTNNLLASMIITYRQFIQTTIKENEVLDKKFYIVIPLYKLELGLIASKEALGQKVKTVLLPRRDQMLRQLNRVGLKATQLTGQKLLQIFFNIYNYEATFGQVPTNQPVRLNQPTIIPLKETWQRPQKEQTVSQIPKPAPISSQVSKTHPFVVEELAE